MSISSRDTFPSFPFLSPLQLEVLFSQLAISQNTIAFIWNPALIRLSFGHYLLL